MRVIYSFVVDQDPRFAYQAWHLARSLVDHCGAVPADIHIQCTQEVDASVRATFDDVGFRTHELTRFGDGRHCNKVVQYTNLLAETFDLAVFLDTDTIAISDLRVWLRLDAIVGKTVDGAATSIDVLREVANAAGLEPKGDIVAPDNGQGETFQDYFNGGMYAIPGALLQSQGDSWKKWAKWLLANPDTLQRHGRLINVDQISFWLALQETGFPSAAAASNANYFVHMDAPHIYHDTARDIALLHYHNSSMNVVGMLSPEAPLSPAALAAVNRANAQIGRHFQNSLFWSYRYTHFPDRGSGTGSRGPNLEYKRDLLIAHGIERASSVLDVGCGDLEVISALPIGAYTGVDVSTVAIENARVRLPSGRFFLGLAEDVPKADMVLCFEVLIHQPTPADYLNVINFASTRTNRTLLISGYQLSTQAIEQNPMVHFHEPLEESLRRSGRFSSIRQIGSHTDVAIFRCDV